MRTPSHPRPRGVLEAAGAVFCLLAAVQAARIADGMQRGLVGIDLQPALAAARVVVAGEGSIYADPHFVYLPSTSLLLAPFAHSGHEFYAAVAYVYMAAVLASVLVAARHIVGGRWWPIVGAVVAIVVLRSQIVTSSAYLENLNALLGLFAVGALAAMHAGRWGLACALLGVSLLVKPALVPLLIVPLIAGRWRPVLLTGGAIAVIVAACASVTPDGWDLLRLPGRLTRDPLSFGLPPLDNLAFSSLGQQHGIPEPLVMLGRVVAAAGALAACTTAWRRREWRRDAVVVGYVVLLAVLLAGRLYELSYVFLFPALPVAVWLIRDRPAAAAMLVVGCVILFSPSQILPAGRTQVAPIWTGGTVLAFTGLVWALLCSSDERRGTLTRAGWLGLSRAPGAVPSSRHLN